MTNNFPILYSIPYRFKPKPVRETVNLYWRKNTGAKLARYSGFDPTHRITFDLIDGEPAPASIKIEKIS